jgi:hypothetical protein
VKKMALYFVTMDLEPDAYPQLPADRLARLVHEAILPSVEALVPLRAAKKLVTGGYLVATPDIKRMQALGEMHHAFEQS